MRLRPSRSPVTTAEDIERGEQAEARLRILDQAAADQIRHRREPGVPARPTPRPGGAR